jgi:FtsH-binding integral membrane protein
MSGARQDRLRFILIFVALYGCILFLIRPDPTRAQTIFRFVLIAIGIGGLACIRLHGERK